MRRYANVWDLSLCPKIYVHFHSSDTNLGCLTSGTTIPYSGSVDGDNNTLTYLMLISKLSTPLNCLLKTNLSVSCSCMRPIKSFLWATEGTCLQHKLQTEGLVFFPAWFTRSQPAPTGGGQSTYHQHLTQSIHTYAQIKHQYKFSQS